MDLIGRIRFRIGSHPDSASNFTWASCEHSLPAQIVLQRASSHAPKDDLKRVMELAAQEATKASFVVKDVTAPKSSGRRLPSVADNSPPQNVRHLNLSRGL